MITILIVSFLYVLSVMITMFAYLLTDIVVSWDSKKHFALNLEILIYTFIPIINY